MMPFRKICISLPVLAVQRLLQKQDEHEAADDLTFDLAAKCNAVQHCRSSNRHGTGAGNSARIFGFEISEKRMPDMNILSKAEEGTKGGEAMAMLEVKKVSKSYKKTEALKQVSFSLDKGIHGLIGPNGAGKSTLFKILTTSLQASSGEIQFEGQPITKNAASYRKKIGYMPQQHSAYHHLKALQFLYYMAALKGIDQKEAKQQIEQLSRKVHLEDVLHRKIGEYSGGMRQRLMFIQALLGNPELLILDEPTSGLDPYERIVLRNHIFDVAQDKIVIIATHVMQDIEYIADQLILLKQGEVLYQGSSVSLLEEMEGHVHEIVLSKEELKIFQHKEQIARMMKTKEGIRVRYICKEKKEGGVHADLEDVYLHYMSNQ